MRDLFNGLIKTMFAASVIGGLWMMTFDWKYWVVTSASLVMLFFVSVITSQTYVENLSAAKSQKPEVKK